MGFVERLKLREDLTKKTIDNHIENLGEGEYMTMTGETTYWISDGGGKAMTFGEVGGVVKLERPYMSLPEHTKELVDKLKGIGYTIDHNH